MAHVAAPILLVLEFDPAEAERIANALGVIDVRCEVVPADISRHELLQKNPSGIILSSCAESVYAETAPTSDPAIFGLGIPILATGYGFRLMTLMLGGRVRPLTQRKRVEVVLRVAGHNDLFHDAQDKCTVSVNTSELVSVPPKGFSVIASAEGIPVAAMVDPDGILFGVEFDLCAEKGGEVLKNFVREVCGVTSGWDVEAFVEDSIRDIKRIVEDGRAVCGLSGGVDSAVSALLAHRAIGDRLTSIFVDHGLMRKNEAQEVVRVFRDELGMSLVHVDASERFLSRLKGVSDPERKRKIIGEEFIRVFEEEAARIGGDFLVQGTVYTDIAESGKEGGSVIKSHHNVGGLPEDVNLKIIEPLRTLYKEQVRQAGTALGLSDDITMRHPFPGPGLAIRIIGEVTAERLDILREADAILRHEITEAGLYRSLGQVFAVLLPLRSVGVSEGRRTYADTIVLRAVTTKDIVTAEWAHLPLDLLAKISSRITSEVHGINRVAYDITSKPPGTIEWE